MCVSSSFPFPSSSWRILFSLAGSSSGSSLHRRLLSIPFCVGQLHCFSATLADCSRLSSSCRSSHRCSGSGSGCVCSRRSLALAARLLPPFPCTGSAPAPAAPLRQQRALPCRSLAPAARLLRPLTLPARRRCRLVPLGVAVALQRRILMACTSV
jgi:hypothetical protein